MAEMKRSERNERLILGIDPGFGRMGYAVVAAAIAICHAHALRIYTEGLLR